MERTGTTKSKSSGSQTIYQLKITLVGIRPPVWRRIQVESDITLGRLHHIIQMAMGWSSSHMHAFNIGGLFYGETDPELELKNENRVKLNSVARSEKSKFRYEYDFGDDWQHDILVEKILPVEPDVKYPRFITGKRACPPEDCGGAWGYASLLEAIADPEHEEHTESLEWFGEDFDPEEFDDEPF